ncbi:MAG TPA: acyl-ACP--UDP-N-acetylglucosamine O-acyltransferase [Vicinamibacterales bacterium]|nr:acyl-ACP--UDP-N-acetylglucosamine O-acyltransferase [Vicinamibacterales bacterium]
MSIDIQSSLDRLCYRYPSPLVDAITEHEPGRRIKAVKNVTVNEDFFQGHFPGSPLMPGVLMIETLAQVATILLVHAPGGPAISGTWLRGVDNAKFRLPVVPGDRLTLEVTMGARRGTSKVMLARARAVASINGNVAAEAELVIGVSAFAKAKADKVEIHATAIVHPGAQIGAGTVIGPYVTIGKRVKIGRACKIGASCVIDGVTEIGDGNEIFPMASIGLVPQDLKFGGEPTRVVIGDRNVIREFVTIHRGTAGGGGLTSIGHHNLLMAYTHVAHDCHIGNNTIFGNAATLAGHVLVEDFANIGAFSGVHQFCRVGKYAFIGGYSVVTKDALPFAKTVGNRARIYGINTIGLIRRGFTQDAITKLRRAYRVLLHANTSRAITQIERDPTLKGPEVAYVVEFIRSSKRGVGLRRPSRRVEEVVED